MKMVLMEILLSLHLAPYLLSFLSVSHSCLRHVSLDNFLMKKNTASRLLVPLHNGGFCDGCITERDVQN